MDSAALFSPVRFELALRYLEILCLRAGRLGSHGHLQAHTTVTASNRGPLDDGHDRRNYDALILNFGYSQPVFEFSAQRIVLDSPPEPSKPTQKGRPI